jgi:hypothetical protein
MKAPRYFYVVFLTLIFSVGDGSGGSQIRAAAQAAEETPRDMLAAKIRMQGVACDRPLSAARDVKRSKPDSAVWILKCNNATFRIRSIPDMAAKIERLR